MKGPPGSNSPVLHKGQSFGTVTEKISGLVLERPVYRSYLLAVGIAGTFMMVLGYSVVYLIWKGVGIWGVNMPVAWGFAIANFVWWIGIGHAGTFISAMLLLMRQDWRTSINRFAEAMTLFAVACAGMFPLMHLGRPWVFYWLVPYPNTMKLWPQFRSPLVWDVFAVSTYLTVSLIFWYVGMIPDLATMRDRAKGTITWAVYGALALGWRGASRHWKRYQTAYLILGALAAPLVISVHSVVGMDFAAALVPGWHTTIFPPYFVAGAIFSGFAMVLTLAIPLRAVYGLHSLVTIRHIDNCGKLMLITGLIVAYGYGTELFMGWYGGNTFEWFMDVNRMTGPYAWSWWTIIFCNVLTPQVLWFRQVRQNVAAMFLISIIVQIGMWTERFVIVVTSLHRDFMPSAWGMYEPTIWDWATLLGTMGFFLFCFFMFVRLFPMISMSEVRELVHSSGAGTHEPADYEPKYAE
jgi:molybdopterin-containing oxidoreductase family membrane subunit